MTRLLIIIATTTAILCGCTGRNSQCATFVDLPQKGWAYGDTVTVMAANLDSINPRALSVGLRHNNEYLYRNLWLEVTYADTAGLYHRDTLNIELADQYGRWTGQGLGDSFQKEVTLPHVVNINDSTPVKLRHIMRLDTLRGIEQIGIRIADYNKTLNDD
ncbi:MAG: gliding motility lipoprotein GldH [Bacteroides sp.]|nr:gliding motility lipoprotein GldH [Bacteroides sp.]MCM1412847.1 gliding motility lipoprotein GldH [Bacteroides sp.]MCM1471516.1 gliding motility lipoprotein GldH [Bacteroides sp.]